MAGIDPRWTNLLTQDSVFPSFVRGVLSGGRVVGVGPGKGGAGGQTWLYRTIPLSPIQDAKNPAEAERATHVLQKCFDALATRASSNIGGRKTSDNTYRAYHLLGLNIPERFQAPPGHPLREMLAREYPNIIVPHRICLFGVGLQPSIKLTGALRDKATQLATSTLERLRESDDRPQSDYDHDHELIDSLLSSAGAETPSTEDLLVADSWWMGGNPMGAVLYPHSRHVHVFQSAAQARAAYELDKRNRDMSGERCTAWGGQFAEVGMQMASVSGARIDGLDPMGTMARWGGSLLRSGALCVSIRGVIEPAKTTAVEMKRNRDRYARELGEQSAAGVETSGRSEDAFGTMHELYDMYERHLDSVPPTSVNTSIVVAMDDTDARDVTQAGSRLAVDLAHMSDLQYPSVAETMLCSPVRANPVLHDLPTHALSCCGLNDVSKVGDPPGNAALLGFTEYDRQPVWVKSDAAAVGDAAPIESVVGVTRSGKTAVGQRLWVQFSRLLRRDGRFKTSLYVNPKPRQPLEGLCSAYGGVTMRFDSLLTSDGGLDPLSFFADTKEGISEASSLVMWLYPGDDSAKRNAELSISSAVAYGVEHGAKATGQALDMWVQEQERLLPALGDTLAARESEADIEAVKKVLRIPPALPKARALIGSGTQEHSGLRFQEGLILIESMAGLIPANMSPTLNDLFLPDKVDIAVVRMIVKLAMNALAHQQAVVFLDEGWVFLLAGEAQMQSLGRQAAALDVLIVLLTQKPGDAEAMSSYISQGMVMSMGSSSQKEAETAFRSLDSSLDPNYHGRALRALTEPNVAGGSKFDPASLKALVDDDRVVHRGSVAYYKDLHGRFATVEILLPDDFLALASTNPEDVARREAADKDSLETLAPRP
jgi:hypothetical protein